MNNENIKTTGVVFGVFDGLHEGHKYLLNESSKIAKEIIVVLTVPEMVSFLKGRLPENSYEDRKSAIQKYLPNVKIVPSDKKPGPWSSLQNLKDFTVILGYDQTAIASELEKNKIPFIFLPAYHPEKYKSSLLRKTI